MTRFVVCLCVLLLPGFSSLCRAGDAKRQRDDAAIEKVVANIMEAARKGDWKRYAELMHPESLEDYKRMWLPVLQAAAKKGPQEQAELLVLFDKAADLKSIIALKPTDFFVVSMKGMASQFREAIKSPLDANEKIIGTVHDGNDLAYVVVRTRTKINETEMTKVELMTMKRNGKEWRMMLPEVVRIMADTFKRSLQTSKAAEARDVPAEALSSKEAAKLQGTWRLVSEEVGGKKSDVTPNTSEWIITGDRITAKVNGMELFSTRFRLPPFSGPKAFDLLEKDNNAVATRAIYTLEGDRLTFAFYRGEMRERPKNFDTGTEKMEKVVRVYQRGTR